MINKQNFNHFNTFAHIDGFIISPVQEIRIQVGKWGKGKMKLDIRYWWRKDEQDSFKPGKGIGLDYTQCRMLFEKDWKHIKKTFQGLRKEQEKVGIEEKDDILEDL